MLTRSLTLIALTAFASAAAAPQAEAGACCGCAYTCAPPPQIQVWGLSPTYVVNQGPVYSGPGFYTAPTYEGEVSTADYPYAGYSFYYPYDRGRYADPFRRRVFHPYWPNPFPDGSRHAEMAYPPETGVIYRRGFGRRAIVMSNVEHVAGHGHRDHRDLPVR